jgi:hypothetical protein
MQAYRFGRKIKLPSTIAIKHQIRRLMVEESVKKAETRANAAAVRGEPREETRPLVQSGCGAEVAPIIATASVRLPRIIELDPSASIF